MTVPNTLSCRWKVPTVTVSSQWTVECGCVLSRLRLHFADGAGNQFSWWSGMVKVDRTGLLMNGFT